MSVLEIQINVAGVFIQKVISTIRCYQFATSSSIFRFYLVLSYVIGAKRFLLYLFVMSEFHLVKSRSRKYKTPFTGGNQTTKSITNVSILPLDLVLKKIDAAKEEILVSPFYKSFLDVLLCGLKNINFDNFVDILCLGLGNFSLNVCSRYQFAFLLQLKDRFKANVLVYDPVFSRTEINAIGHLNCELIPQNDWGRHDVRERQTFVFLPHCSSQLLNNFLWVNWCEGLKYCVVLGNSITSIVTTHTNHNLEKDLLYIYKIHAYTKELNIDNCFRLEDVFNDLSIHLFPAEFLTKMPHDMKSLHSEPPVNDEDMEFITNRLKSVMSIDNEGRL